MATDLFGRMQYGYKPDLGTLTDEIDLRWIKMQTEWLALTKVVKGEENYTLQTKIRKFEEIIESDRHGGVCSQVTREGMGLRVMGMSSMICVAI